MIRPLVSRFGLTYHAIGPWQSAGYPLSRGLP